MENFRVKTWNSLSLFEREKKRSKKSPVCNEDSGRNLRKRIKLTQDKHDPLCQEKTHLRNEILIVKRNKRVSCAWDFHTLVLPQKV